MIVGAARPSRRSTTLLAALVYALVVLAAAFEHHDLLCHLQHPQHCTACAATQLSPDPQALTVPSTSALADAGLALTTIVVAEGALLTVRSTGRSPPFVA
jgi:hypothetical protein